MPRGTASIVASPVLVGAVTALVLLIAVVLAYNANQGLPFVPTYDVKAELPSGANLVEGNEVRVGGFRVGVIDRIAPRTIEEDGQARAIAVVDMKLDKVVEPLSTDTQILVRPRSALGLKYIELVPGTERTTFRPGDTIPLANTGEPVEFDQFLNTFDQGLREDSRTALQGYGDALAGRGQSINVALEQFPRFFGSLQTVMDTLNDESTELDQFFLQIGRAAAQAAPVDEIQAELFTHMADTFEAFSRDPAALQAAIEEAPPTLEEGIDSFPVQRAFMDDFTELSNRLRPAVQELDDSLPPVTSAFVEGQEVLPRTVFYNRRVGDVLRAVDRLASNPNTLLALQDLRTLNESAAGLVRHVAPSQTVCNYFNYFFTPLGDHLSEQVPGGTLERILAKTDPGAESQQYNRFGAYGANRPADIPKNLDPDHEHEYYAFHAVDFAPFVDARGRADCQEGQHGFTNGPVSEQRYPPAVFDNSGLPSENEGRPPATVRGGGSSTTIATRIPYLDDGGRAGPTFDPNSPDGLGVERLSQVP